MPAKERPAWTTLLMVALVIILLGGGGITMIAIAIRHWNAERDSDTIVKRETPPATAIQPAATPTLPEAATPVPTAPVASTPSQPEAAPAPSASRPAPAAARPPPRLATRTKAPVLWPSLSLSGIVGDGSLGAASLNGRIVGVGEMISGVKVVHIGRGGAKLEYEGETRFLKVGNAIE